MDFNEDNRHFSFSSFRFYYKEASKHFMSFGERAWSSWRMVLKNKTLEKKLLTEEHPVVQKLVLFSSDWIIFDFFFPSTITSSVSGVKKILKISQNIQRRCGKKGIKWSIEKKKDLCLVKISRSVWVCDTHPERRSPTWEHQRTKRHSELCRSCQIWPQEPSIWVAA